VSVRPAQVAARLGVCTATVYLALRTERAGAHSGAERHSDIDDRTDLAALVQRIDARCRSAGLMNYELRALGTDGRTLGSEQIDLTMSPPSVNRGRRSSDERVALQLIVEYGRLLSQLVAALQMEQKAVREEGCELRRLLTRLADQAS
jgi:hypothetical protein